MKQPQQPLSTRAMQGFTLLEVMLVMVLMGLAASFVVFNAFGVNQSDQLKKEANRLQVLMDMASDYAVLNQRQLGVRFEKERREYYFVYLDDDDKWQKINNEKLYAPHTLADQFTFSLNLDDLPWDTEDQLFERDVFDENFSLDDTSTNIGDEEEKVLPPPQVLIMSSGEITPFSLAFIYEPGLSSEQPVYFELQNKDIPPLLLNGPLENLPE
ncbi:type II secretion system minor pseudopilin GspH [Alteromonas sp. C1M14]|uniref:type II secretion system minor pseudopilin GspH n=1 Tax=Alteromonas sp. C1M14 TaxID=2841567 RepID=UPI001C08B747|nr:type II secretion system minor pseudopilin GspH [Alteromonas sp. C1M14]MBU2978319.1 type II secretion system minor pseudopilin GspH [Alteromonas sp. C1M14]